MSFASRTSWCGSHHGFLHCLRPRFQRQRPNLSSLPVQSVLTQDVNGGPYVTQLHLPVNDLPTEDLLQRLPGAVAFIGDALAAGGRVLVHCVAGMSRSATVVAAYLMASEQLDTDKALAALRAAYPQACPNDGFYRQLALFGSMACHLDPGNAALRRYRAEAALEQSRIAYASGGVACVNASAMPSPSEADAAGDQV